MLANNGRQGNNRAMTTQPTPTIGQEFIERARQIGENQPQRQLELSVEAASLIVDTMRGVTKDVELYIAAMYTVQGQTDKALKHHKQLVDELNKAKPGDLIGTYQDGRWVSDALGGATGARGLTGVGCFLPTEEVDTGAWQFEVSSPYINDQNGLPSFVGDLMLSGAVELGGGMARTLNKKWLNHGYYGNNDEPYCQSVRIGVEAIMSDGVSEREAKLLQPWLQS